MIRLPSFKQYCMVIGVAVLLLILSWIGTYGFVWAQSIAILAILTSAVVAWKRPAWLALMSIGELVTGGKGYVLSLHLGSTNISLRMIVFAIVLITAIPLVLKQWSELRKSILSNAFLAFIGWLIVAIVVALVRGIHLGAIYSDANAFVFLALLPAWWVLLRQDERWKELVIAVLLGGATIVGLMSWVFVLLFARTLPNIHHWYSWIRNSGLGEVTYINNNIYRVFLQSQIYGVLVVLGSLAIWLRQRTPRWWLVPMAFSALAVYISLSRSFWLGLTAAGIVLIVISLRRRSWRELKKWWIVVPLGIFAWAMMVWAISWPAFSLHGSDAAVGSRFNGSGSENAATARTKQFKPLLKAIGRHPVIGSGFGQTVTYFSTDPTVHGWRTTFAFELGYLDLWLKIGLLGMVLYVWWLFTLFRKMKTKAWALPLMIGGIALLVIHLTTPYLNHPLGLGWLMLTAIFAYGV